MERILHVMGGLNSGGSETLVMNYYRNIDKTKFQFDFVIHTNDKQFYEEEINKLGGKIYRMPKYNILNHFIYKKKWEKLYKQLKDTHIVHGHMRSTASIYLKIAKEKGLKTICHSHSTSNGKSIKSTIQYFYQLPIRKIADYFIGCSMNSCIWLFGKKVANSERCLIIPNCIKTKDFLYNEEKRIELRKKYKIKDSDVVIGHVGRFVKAKNHKLIFNVFKELSKKNNKYKLILIGDGPLKKKYQKIIETNNFERKVLMLESQKNINDYYNIFDVFLFPSLYEGFGMTLIEAQTNGLNCITGDVIPKEAIFSDKCYISQYNTKKISKMIETLNFDDRTTNNDKLEYYSIEYNTKKITDIYIKLSGEE